MQNDRPAWSSKYTFMLSAVGSAVGLGNIWRFPYVMGEYGGAVFLVTYLLIIFTLSFIPLISEIYFGKKSQKDCIGSYEDVHKGLKPLAYLNPITGILICSFYFIVGGWIIHYIFYFNSGLKDYSGYFSNFTKTPLYSCFLTLCFLFICIFFTARGVKKGIEIANKVLMPIFAVILVVLVIFSLNLPNASKGIEYMFKPDFSKLNFKMILAALGQAFFTLSVGMGALLTYGSYMSKDQNVTKAGYVIVISDTMFALLAGVMIFPAVFSFGLAPNSGPGLVFVTIPEIFAKIPYGHIISSSFFILLFCASVTSGISMLEVPCAILVERFNITRVKSCVILFFIISLLAIPATLSFDLLANFKIFSKSIFDFLDFTTSNILMPLNVIIMCLILGWMCKVKGNEFFKNKLLIKFYDVGLKYIVPVILLCLMWFGLE